MWFEVKTTFKNLVLNLCMVGLLIYVYSSFTYESTVGYVLSYILIVLFTLYIILQHVLLLAASINVKDTVIDMYLKKPGIDQIIKDRFSVDELYQYGYVEVHKQNNIGNMLKCMIIMFIIFTISFM